MADSVTQKLDQIGGDCLCKIHAKLLGLLELIAYEQKLSKLCSSDKKTKQALLILRLGLKCLGPKLSNNWLQTQTKLLIVYP